MPKGIGYDGSTKPKKLKRKKHSPAGQAHLEGYSLGATGQALKRAKRIHKRTTALDEVTRHDKILGYVVPAKKKKVHYRAYGYRNE